MQEWYLGWEKVSCLERCPQFRSVLLACLYGAAMFVVYQFTVATVAKLHPHYSCMVCQLATH